jgi:hypothetical protein
MSSGTPTPKLGLHTFDTLDDIDYDEINSNSLEIEDKLSLFTCTSGTRPTTGLFDGRLIRESDTERVVRYDGASSSWKRVTPGKYETWAANWATNGNTLAIGDGTLVAKKRQMNDHVDFFFSLTRGATTNFGATNVDYTWDAPSGGNFPEMIGTGLIVRGGVYTFCYLLLVNGSNMVLVRASDGVRIQNNATFVWNTGDRILFRGSMSLAGSNG